MLWSCGSNGIDSSLEDDEKGKRGVGGVDTSTIDKILVNRFTYVAQPPASCMQTKNHGKIMIFKYFSRE